MIITATISNRNSASCSDNAYSDLRRRRWDCEIIIIIVAVRSSCREENAVC